MRELVYLSRYYLVKVLAKKLSKNIQTYLVIVGKMLSSIHKFRFGLLAMTTP